MSMLEVLSEELLHKEFGEHVRAEQQKGFLNQISLVDDDYKMTSLILFAWSWSLVGILGR